MNEKEHDSTKEEDIRGTTKHDASGEEADPINTIISATGNSVSRQRYRMLMLGTAEKVGPCMLSYLQPLQTSYPGLYELCAELPEKKSADFETRAYFTRAAYELCAKHEWTEDVVHAAAAFTLELCSMYYTNRIFDRKGGERILSRPNNQVIAAMLTRDFASQALKDATKNLEEKTAHEIQTLLERVNQDFYEGQFYELNLNVPPAESRLAEEQLLQEYYKRNYLMNNSLFEKIAIASALLSDASTEQKEAMAQFGRNYGMMLQIINDIADFVPASLVQGTEEKIPEDAYADLKQGRLTLPAIHALFHAAPNDRRQISQALSVIHFTEPELINVTRMLLRNKSIRYAQRMAEQFARDAKSCLSIFPAEQRIPLEDMCFIAYTNRYYKALQKLK